MLYYVVRFVKGSTNTSSDSQEEKQYSALGSSEEIVRVRMEDTVFLGISK